MEAADMIGMIPRDFSQERESFILTPLRDPQHGEIGLGFDEILIQRQSALELGEGFGISARGPKHFAEVIVKSGDARQQCDGSANQRFGEIHAANLLGEHTEKMRRLGMIGVRSQDFPINSLGIGEAILGELIAAGGLHHLGVRGGAH
jgi:hypothetical protein